MKDEIRMAFSQATVSFCLPAEMAVSLYDEIGVYVTDHDPALATEVDVARIAAELGATLEDAGLLPDEPDPAGPAAGGNVIPIFVSPMFDPGEISREIRKQLQEADNRRVM